jgi:hypothetical protein
MPVDVKVTDVLFPEAIEELEQGIQIEIPWIFIDENDFNWKTIDNNCPYYIAFNKRIIDDDNNIHVRIRIGKKINHIPSENDEYIDFSTVDKLLSYIKSDTMEEGYTQMYTIEERDASTLEYYEKATQILYDTFSEIFITKYDPKGWSIILDSQQHI